MYENMQLVGSGRDVSIKLEDGKYLHWFRGYGFQVSETEDGQNTVARSQMTMHYNYTKDIFTEEISVRVLYCLSYLFEAMLDAKMPFDQFISNPVAVDFIGKTRLLKNAAVIENAYDIFSTLVKQETTSQSYPCFTLKFTKDEIEAMYGNSKVYVELKDLLDFDYIQCGCTLSHAFYCRMAVLFGIMLGINTFETSALVKINYGNVYKEIKVDDMLSDLCTEIAPIFG